MMRVFAGDRRRVLCYRTVLDEDLAVVSAWAPGSVPARGARIVRYLVKRTRHSRHFHFRCSLRLCC